MGDYGWLRELPSEILLGRLSMALEKYTLSHRDKIPNYKELKKADMYQNEILRRLQEAQVKQVKQIYISKNDTIGIKFTFNDKGKLLEFKEVDPNGKMYVGDIVLPRVEVTDEFFFKIINNPKLN